MTQEDMKILAELITKVLDEKTIVFEEKFKAIEERFDAIEERFDAIEERFDAIEKRFNALEEKLIKVQQELKEDIQRLRNNLFILENDYGKKIDALYDSREIELEKEREAIAARASINKRIDHLEVVQWKNEKRIASLEKEVHA